MRAARLALSCSWVAAAIHIPPAGSIGRTRPSLKVSLGSALKLGVAHAAPPAFSKADARGRPGLRTAVLVGIISCGVGDAIEAPDIFKR